MGTSILVVDDNEITLKLVTATLQSDGYEIHTAQNGTEALEKAARIRPAMAILDVMMPDMDGYTLCQRMRQMPATATIPILILTAFGEINEKLQAFEAGADDFMPKPFQPPELQARVRVHLRRMQAQAANIPADSNAKKIAVFSLRGGIGVSSVAVNLAAGLAQLWKTPTLLIDMALANGQAALMFDLPLRNTWADLGKNSPDELDMEMFRKVLLRHESGVDVIAAPQRIADAERVTAAHVSRVLELAQAQYHYLVIDLPHDFSETTLAALDQADIIIHMLAPDLASVRCASGAMDVFDELGYDPEKIHLALNWTFPSKGLARKEIETALQKPVKVVIPHIPDAMVNALMIGKPLALEAEENPASALFEDLAYYWSKEEHKNKAPAQPGKVYLRVQERMQKRAQKQAKS